MWGGGSKSQSAGYDAFSNMLSTTTTDWGTQSFALSSGTNRLNSPVTYDGAGSMKSWGGFTYTYEALNQMQTVTGTGVNHTYLYTADGERISDRDAQAGTTTLTVRDLGAKVLRIYTKSGSTWSWSKDYVYRTGLLLASIDGTETRHFSLDHLGSPRLVTAASGVVRAGHTYYPFGMEASATCQDTERMKFTGQERDSQGTCSSQTDDLDDMHARYYNPNIARFLATDPVSGNPETPQSWNLYAYVRNNPINAMDPDGRLGANAAQQAGVFLETLARLVDPLGAGSMAALVESAINSWSNLATKAETTQDSESASKSNSQQSQPTSRPYTATAQQIKAAEEQGKAVGNGQCVPYIQQLTGAPRTKHWIAGTQAWGAADIGYGTAIATMVDGRYPQDHKHAAIYLGQNREGLQVSDQWLGQPPHTRTVTANTPSKTRQNRAESYFVILSEVP